MSLQRQPSARRPPRATSRAAADKPAFVAPDATLTYDELRAQVNRAGPPAARARRRAASTACCSSSTTRRRSRSCSSARCGSAPCPCRSATLDKADNFRHFVEDSYATVVVDRRRRRCRGCARRSAATTLRYVARGGDGRRRRRARRGLAAQDDELDPAPTHRDDMAFWLYSSGSTGKPKGVVHLHHDIEVTCESYAGQVLGLREDDVTFSTTKLFHAYGLGNGLSFPLWFGATSVLMRGPTRPEPILATLREHRPTVFFSVPALFGGARARRRRPTARSTRVRFVRVGRRGAAAADVRPLAASASASRSSTASARPRCSTSSARTGRARSSRARPAGRCRATSCGIVDEDGARARGPGGRRARGPRRLVRGVLLAPAREDQERMRGDWFATGDRYERRDGRRLRLRGADGRHAQGRRPVGLADRHGARAARAPARARRRRRRRHGRRREPDRRLRRVRRRRAGRRRARRGAARRGARSACAATSTRTSSSSSTSCRAR